MDVFHAPEKKLASVMDPEKIFAEAANEPIARAGKDFLGTECGPATIPR